MKVCGDSFTQKSNLKRHFTSKHEKPLKCFKCPQRFAKALELDLHYDVAHPGVKKPKIDRKNLELIGTFRCVNRFDNRCQRLRCVVYPSSILHLTYLCSISLV